MQAQSWPRKARALHQLRSLRSKGQGNQKVCHQEHC